ncbi:recombinase family protein [Streptomyces sp. B5E4]|uniref:recombinase family protein n=1 Tax=Streptomyces sp. B5E4 TaxID=3153568 RepID=UPI00325D8DB9
MASTDTLPLFDAPAEVDALGTWANRRAVEPGLPDRLRFAFYGRVSTEDYQDPETSRGWQLLRAQALVAGHGRVTAEFLDVGHSRVLPWPRRPEAARLIDALADPDRTFDAVVIGSSERAFHGSQFAAMAPLFEHHGVRLWLPELGGPVDPGLAGHEELMILLGIVSKREIARARLRARTAMTVQAREQGRYLGGRPPYGYRLTDAGPHPNRAWARRGARAQRLEADPTTAPVVSWMFAQRRAGKSQARIARALNNAAVPCPSASDPERNAHRSGSQWTLTAVRAILANPRYTGRQVWNRQRTDQELIDPANTALGHRDIARWNPPQDWVISREKAHPALVEADFVAVQGTRATTTTPGRTYLLTGLLRCGLCGRRMESCWTNGHPAYRCRHGHTSATGPGTGRPRNAYIREDRILARLPALLLRLGHPRTGDHSPGDPSARAAAEWLRTQGINLTYDPADSSLTAGTPTRERIIIG